MLFPFLWMFITSIKPDPELYNPRLFVVRDPTLTHWSKLFSDTLFVQWAINTFWVACVDRDLAVRRRARGYALARLIFPARRSSASRSSSPTWCRPRCCSSR